MGEFLMSLASGIPGLSQLSGVGGGDNPMMNALNNLRGPNRADSLSGFSSIADLLQRVGVMPTRPDVGYAHQFDERVGEGETSPVKPVERSESAPIHTPLLTPDPVTTTMPGYQRAFLNAVARGESGGQYDLRYTPKGGQKFEDLSKHPGIMEPGPEGPSSAAGRYQFTKSTWDAMGGGEFSPERQDQQAWALAVKDYKARTGKSLDADLQEKGLTPEIMRALSPTWTSFRSNHAQSERVYNDSLKRYSQEGDFPTVPQEGNQQVAAGGDFLGKRSLEDSKDWSMVVIPLNGQSPQDVMKDYPEYEGWTVPGMEDKLWLRRPPAQPEPVPTSLKGGTKVADVVKLPTAMTPYQRWQAYEPKQLIKDMQEKGPAKVIPFPGSKVGFRGQQGPNDTNPYYPEPVAGTLQDYYNKQAEQGFNADQEGTAHTGSIGRMLQLGDPNWVDKLAAHRQSTNIEDMRFIRLDDYENAMGRGDHEGAAAIVDTWKQGLQKMGWSPKKIKGFVRGMLKEAGPSNIKVEP